MLLCLLDCVCLHAFAVSSRSPVCVWLCVCLSYGPQDVGPDHAVRLLVAEDLHQTVCIRVGLRSAVGREGEFPHLVGDALHTHTHTLDIHTPGYYSTATLCLTFNS